MAAAYLPQAAPTTRQPKGWIPTLVVAALMIGIVAGGFIGEDAVQDEPARPVSAGSGVVITPIGGWDFAGRSEDGNTVLLTNGAGSLAVTTDAGTDVDAALTALRDEWVATGTVTAGELESVDLGGGRAGKRFDYSGTFEDVPTPVEGAVTGLAGSGYVVLFDGWAGMGDYTIVSDQIEKLISTAIIP